MVILEIGNINMLSQSKVSIDEIVRTAEGNLEEMAGLIENLTISISDDIACLYDYVTERRLPSALSTENEEQEISQCHVNVGSFIDLASGQSHSGLGAADDNIKNLHLNARLHLCLDFPDDYIRFLCKEPWGGVTVFTLEDMAFLSGRNIGSIRNSALEKGDLQTVNLEGLLNLDMEEIKQSVFVEHKEAIRWLKSKYCYEELKSSIGGAINLPELIWEHASDFADGDLPSFLLLREKGDLKTYYAPFEYINLEAKIVICGITPGRSQADIALNTYANALKNGSGDEAPLKIAKESASFAGGMRKSLSKMLDYVGLNDVLKISSCDELFGEHKDLVHYASALRNPVFYKGGNYNGTPAMLRESSLKWQIDRYLADEVMSFGPNTLFIPLGPKPAEVLSYLADKNYLKKENILDGFPHPSGANAERIKYFCKEKEKDQLSIKTNAVTIDKARQSILEKIVKLK